MVQDVGTTTPAREPHRLLAVSVVVVVAVVGIVSALVVLVGTVHWTKTLSAPYEVGLSTANESIPSPGLSYVEVRIDPTPGLTTAMIALNLTSISGGIEVGRAPSSTCLPTASLTPSNCGAPVLGAWYCVLIRDSTSTILNVFSWGTWVGQAVNLTNQQSLVIVSNTNASLVGSWDTFRVIGVGQDVVSPSISL